jgi:hypothetical protein
VTSESTFNGRAGGHFRERVTFLLAVSLKVLKRALILFNNTYLTLSAATEAVAATTLADALPVGELLIGHGVDYVSPGHSH